MRDAPPPAGTVLVVDDDRETVDALLSLAELDAPGLHMIGSTSPEEALELLGSHHVTGVVADLQMHGMDGFAFLAEVHRRTPEARLVLLTGSDSGDLEKQAFASHIEEVVGKPVDPHKFVALARRLAVPRRRPASG